jgi:hypothetical protein
MSDQTKLAALSDGPTADIVRSAGAVRSFQQGGRVQVVRNKDDPYLAGMSEDHRRVYIDRRVPRQITVKGKTFDPAKYLIVHETIERRHMDKGMKYEVAHRLALKAERAAVEADGINWNGYQGQMHRLAGITEKEKHVHPPNDLYKGPFPRREQNKLTKEGDTAPDIVGSTKSYAEGGEVTSDQDRPATPEEMQQYGLDPNGPGRQATPEEMQQYNLDPNGPPDYSVAGEALKRGAQAVLPGLGSIPAMIGGAAKGEQIGEKLGTAIGGGLGLLAGPEGIIPGAAAGRTIGGLGGAAVGGIAANVSLRKIQDWFLDKLGMTPDQAKAQAFQQEHPDIASAADIAGSLAGMSPARGTVTMAQRAVMGAGQGGLEAGSEYLHTGELDPSDIAMAAAAGAAFPGLNKLGEPLGQLGTRLASKVGVRAGRPDMNPGQGPMKQLPAPPDFTTSAEGETAAYPGGDDQVFSQAAAPRPGNARENERPIYEMPRSEWTSTRPGTRDVDNIATGAENEIQSTKNEEDITADKYAATPAHAGYDPNSTLSTSHEMARPKQDQNIGNPQSFPVGSERDYRTTTDSNVNPTASGAGNPPTGEMLDPATGNIPQDMMQALTQDNGPGRNTPPRGLKAADKRMQKSMRVPFQGEAANENVEGSGQPTPPPLPELEARRGGEPTKEELEGVPPTPTFDVVQGGKQPGELYREVHPSIRDAYWQGQEDYRNGKFDRRYDLDEKNAAWDRGMQDAMTASRNKPSNTGIVEGAVTDTAAKLRKYDLPGVADAVEKNPSIEPQARRILQDVTGTGPQYESGLVDAETMRRGMRAMEAATTPEERDRAMKLMEQARNPNTQTEAPRATSNSTVEQKATLGGGEETVATATVKEARQKQFAAQAAQTAFEQHPPTDNRIPTTQVEKDLFVRRLSNALETAKSENLGKDPLAGVGSKRTAAQEWLRAARKLVSAKNVTPKMISDFIDMENAARAGLKGSEIRGVKENQNLNQRVATGEEADTIGENPTASRGGTANSVEDEMLDRIDEARETYKDLAKNLLTNEDGSVDITKIMKAIWGAFGPQARNAALDYRARTPRGVKEAYANTLSNILFKLRQQGKDQRVALLKEALSNPYLQDRDVMQRTYFAHEQGDLSKLSPDEQAKYDKTLKPVVDANNQLYDNIEKLVPGILGPKVTNHIYRIAKGLHPLFGGDPLGMDDMPRGLSKTASMAKERKFMAMEDGAGGREVISPTKNGYTIWKNGNGQNFQNAAFEPKEGNVFRDANGKVWTVKGALTPEIEANAKFENGKPAEYVHNAAMSIFEEHAYLSDMARHLQFFEDIKNDRIPELSLAWKEITTTDPKVARDNGWQESTFPQMKGTYMTDHVRYVFDDFAKQGLKDDALDKLRRLSMGVTKLMFWTPVAHIFNVGTHGIGQRGLDWSPIPIGNSGGLKAYSRLYRTSVQAFQSVRNQDNIQSEIRQMGGGTVYGGVITNDFMGELGRAFGETINKAPSKWDPIARVFGISSKDLADSVYRNSSKLMWAANDMIYTQSYLEKLEKGMTPQEAMIRTEQHIPNYRLPTTIMGSRAAAKVVGEPLAFAFSPYHYGMFNSYAHDVKDLIKGTGAERVDAIGKIMVMGAMGMVMYPMLDKAASYITGNPDAEAHRRGPIAIPNALVRAFQGHGDITQSLRSTMTLSPLAATAMEAYNNRDYANREILQKGTVARIGTGPNRLQAAGSAAVQEGEHVARGLVSPYGTAANALDAKRNLVQGLRDQLLDIKNPTPQAVRYEKVERLKAIEAERQRAQKNQGRGPLERIYNQVTR